MAGLLNFNYHLLILSSESRTPSDVRAAILLSIYKAYFIIFYCEITAIQQIKRKW